MLEAQSQPKHNNGRRHSSATKQTARRLRRNGLTHREISEKMGIAVSTAHLWTVGIKLTPNKKAEIEKRRVGKLHRWSPEEKKAISQRLKSYQFKKKHTHAKLIIEIVDFVERHNRIPLKSEFGSRRTFRTFFGTWNNAIRTAGYEPNPELYSKRISAADGHTCDSFAEQIIDNWLSTHKIPHLIHHRYQESKMTADFYIANRNTYIEYFGLCGVNPRYDYHMKKKLAFIKRHCLNLVALYPGDISKNKLAEKLSILLP